MAEVELHSTLDGYVTVNKVNTLNDSIKGVSKATKQANNTIKALTEVLKVNPEDLKKVLIMGALKDAAEGKEVTYEGNVWKDILELVEELQKENEGLKKENGLHEKTIKDLRFRIDKAENILMCVKAPINIFCGNGWVSKREANDAIINITENCYKVTRDAWAALQGATYDW